MRLQPEPVIKTHIGSHWAGGWGAPLPVCAFLQRGPEEFKKQRVKAEGLFDQIFMNLIMKWITLNEFK